jgi:hypothetical protein
MNQTPTKKNQRIKQILIFRRKGGFDESNPYKEKPTNKTNPYI